MASFRHYTRDPWYLISVCLRRQGRDPACFRRLLSPGKEPEFRHTPPPLEALVRALPYLSADPGTLEKLDEAYDGELFPKLETAERHPGPVPFAPLRMLARYSPREARLDDYLLRNSCELHAGGPQGEGVCLLFVEPGGAQQELPPGTRLWVDSQAKLRSGLPVLAAARDGSYRLRLLKLLPEGKALLPATGNPRHSAMGPEQVRRRIRWLLPVLAAEIRLLA